MLLLLTWTRFHFQIGVRFARQEDPLPYMVSQPLPWQIHSVSHSRRGSKAEEVSSCWRTKAIDSLWLIQGTFIPHDWLINYDHIFSAGVLSGLNHHRSADVSFFDETQIIKLDEICMAAEFCSQICFSNLLFYQVARLSMCKVQRSNLTQHVSI